MLGFFVNFCRNVKKYFENISIHGLCSIFRSTYLPEMVFWIIIFLIAVHYFYELIYNNLIQFYNQPVTKSVDTTAHPVTAISFPAITVCNYNLVYKSLTANFTAMLIQSGIKEDVVLSFLKSLSLLKTPRPFDAKPFLHIYKVLARNGYSKDSIWMESLAQPCHRLLQYCDFRGKPLNCSDIFTRSKSSHGFCCSFNSNLYPIHETDYFTYAGPMYGLYLRFNVDEEEYVTNIFNVTGVLVLVHNKDSYPNFDTDFHSIVEPGKQLAMKLIPSVFNAELNVQNLPITARQCWFENEGIKLSNLNYTFENCIHLCKTNAIANMCGCIPYYHVDYERWRDCTLLDVSCLSKNYRNFSALDMKFNVHDTNKKEILCDCLPSCSDTSYRGVVDSLYYKNKQGIIYRNYSGVRIYFQSNWCKKYVISLSMTFETFIASVGGFFSLCVGGSLLSACELVYYLLKSLFTKAQKKDKTVEKAEHENFPPLYWSEMRTYQAKTGKVNKNVVILNPYFQNTLIN